MLTNAACYPGCSLDRPQVFRRGTDGTPTGRREGKEEADGRQFVQSRAAPRNALGAEFEAACVLAPYGRALAQAVQPSVRLKGRRPETPLRTAIFNFQRHNCC